ncbi:MAG TPA: glutathione S-transferase family protein [Candidatus Limnocylindrales bacterium]|nr:glutathione S-transferase family protein [Candidatus Limnocylindrales bacterium]
MIRFYYGSGSPFAWRVQLVLEEKNIPYEPVLLSFSAGDTRKPEYLAISPHGKVPAMTDDDLVLYESQAIVEYLEERHPTPPLMPKDAAERALVRIEELECTIYLFEAFRVVGQQMFFTPPEQRDEKTLAERKADVHAQIVRLEARARERGGQFIAGNHLTRADLAWLPFVEISGRAKIAFDQAQTPWLLEWRERMRQRASYERSYPPHWRK